MFPKKCVICGKLDTLFCDNCRSGVVFLRLQSCPFCNRISPGGRLCSVCRRRHFLSGVMVMAHFEEPLKKVIYRYKYGFIKALSDDLAEIAWPLFHDFGEDILLTCVPSSASRITWRGYNQAEELAKKLAKHSGVTFMPDLLKRTKFIIPQTELSQKERLQNVEHAFEAKKTADLSVKKVVIVDDLVTSGATLDACAKEIKKLGARQVWGFVLARHR